MKGIIVKGIGGFYYIKESQGNVYECKARGVFRKNNIKPTVGDVVDFENGSINKIYERKSYLIRPSVANIDNLIIVIAAANPAPDLLLADKLIVAALSSDINPVICINKTDLADYDKILMTYTSAGFDVVTVSAKDGDGIEKLKHYITGKVSAFAGLSGVGKSSILNLLGKKNAEIGEISRINRGKHTTRHVELYDVGDDTFILDTPGFSSLAINEICSITADELSSYYPEFDNVSEECRFKGCSHLNEPDCAVKKLLDEGVIARERYHSYKELYTTLKDIKQW